MAFVKLTGESSRPPAWAARVTVRSPASPHPALRLSAATLRDMRIGPGAQVVVWYDRDAGRLGLEPVRTPDPGSVLRLVNKNNAVGLGAFFHFYNIDFREWEGRYPRLHESRTHSGKPMWYISRLERY